MPAHAIIAPLSVQSFCGGADHRQARFAAEAGSSAARIAELAATPPATTTARGAVANAFAEEFEPHPHAVFDYIDDRGLKRGAKVVDVAWTQRGRRFGGKPNCSFEA